MGKWQKFGIDGSLVDCGDERDLQKSQTQNTNRIRQKTTEIINLRGIDSATQQNASLGIYSPERCEAIKSYIAACRNEYLRCKSLILAAQTNDEADRVQFVPPPVPEGL